MILPDNARCIEVIQALAGEPSLTDWEEDFIESNIDHSYFTAAQKEVIARLEEKYEVWALPQSEFVEAIRVTDGMWVLREHGF